MMRRLAYFVSALAITLVAWSGTTWSAGQTGTGSVIFIHPDGAGLNAWNACRMHKAGPDGELAWDRLPRIGVYRGHMKDGLTATSHGGATTHAYGVKVPADSYGMHAEQALEALSGFPGSIMQESQRRGKAVGIVNSGHIGEPGTGVFLASSPSRRNVADIAEQIITSGAQVIMSGGEKYLLPAGRQGFHGPGVRTDGKDLLAYAESQGYKIVYTNKQLQNIDLKKTDRLLGIFALSDTYNALPQQQLDTKHLPRYAPRAPTFAEMVTAALAVLSRHENGFLLVAEEEGSDNFGNVNNAAGVLEALARADDAFEAALRFLASNPDTLLLTVADSDAGGMQVISSPTSPASRFSPVSLLPLRMGNGAPLHGAAGRRSTPFSSAPDSNGRVYAFGIAFASAGDVPGAILARAGGLNSDRLPLNADNTDIYRLMYLTLFGEGLGLREDTKP